MRGFLEARKNSLGDARIPQGWQELPGDFLEETRIHREGLPSGPKLPEGRSELPKGSQRCPSMGRQGFLRKSTAYLGETPLLAGRGPKGV